MKTISMFTALFNGWTVLAILKACVLGCNFPEVSSCTLYTLYESFIPVNALTYFVAAHNPSKKRLKTLLEAVIIARKELCKDSGVLKVFENMSMDIETSDIPDKFNRPLIKRILKERNSVIKEDEAYIFRGYIEEAQEKSKGCKEKWIPRELSVRDTRYLEMIESIVRSVEGNENIYQRLKLEREMFYRPVLKVPPATALLVRRNINLGGGIFVPEYLIRELKKVKILKKEEKIRGWVRALLQPVEELELQTRLMKGHERKSAVEEFSENCIHRNNSSLDWALKARSEILEYSGNKQNVDSEQERAVKGMLQVVRNMDVDFAIVRYSRDIEEAYSRFLITSTDASKEKLLKLLE